MLTLIIKKEIQENLLNARFAVASVVSLILIISSIVVLTENYESELRDYRSRVTTQDNFIDQFGHWNRAGWMGRAMRIPSHFQVLVLGIDREAQQENFASNPISALLSRLDFVTIVTIIMSLMAILFSYNAISGEREAGLLRQMLSTGVSRSTIIFGKFIGGNISLLTPFTVGVLGGLLYLALSSRLQLQSADFGVFLLLLLASWLYISAFYGLGLLFSARSHTSSQAVLKSLFAWVVLVLVIPNISPFLAAESYPIPSAAKIKQETTWLTSDERDEIIRRRWRKLQETQFADLRNLMSMNQSEIQARLENDPLLKERYAEFARECDEMVSQVNREQREKADKISETFVERSKYQERFATIFASVSPFANFVFIATDATETGIDGENRWNNQAGTYGSELKRYANAKYQKEKEKNPAFGYNDYLDFRDRARFQYQPQSVAERIESVLPQFGLLVFFNLLFLAIAFVSFVRYDVR